MSAICGVSGTGGERTWSERHAVGVMDQDAARPARDSTLLGIAFSLFATAP
ncbi:MAG: hypothetical protein R3F49_07940 [Planctomycetota bacterium]